MRTQQRKGDRPEQLGSLHEHRGADVDRRGRRLDRVATDRFAQRPQQHLAGPAHQPADDHPLGVDEIAEPRDGHADLPARVGEGAPAAQVAACRELNDPRQGEDLTVYRPDELDDGRPGGDGFQAATVAAVTKRSLLVEGRVPDLAGRTGRASQQAPVDHDPGADAGRRLDVGKVRTVPPRAPGQLGQRAEVRVVLDLDRDPKALLHLRRDAKPDPTREDGGRPGGAVGAVDRPGNAHTHAQHARALHGDLGQDLRKHGGCDVERSSGLAIDVQVIPAFREHVVAEVRDGDRHVAVPEVDADHDVRGIPKHELHARSPSTGVSRPGVDVRNQARLFELGDQSRHRGARETGGARDVGLADLAVHPEDLHHALAVAVPQPGKGPVTVFRAGHSRDIMVWARRLSRAQTNCRSGMADNLTNPRS